MLGTRPGKLQVGLEKGTLRVGRLGRDFSGDGLVLLLRPLLHVHGQHTAPGAYLATLLVKTLLFLFV